MRYLRLLHAALALSLLVFAGFMATTSAPVLYAQSNISGDIAGIITDSSGAIVPNATITVTSPATGATRAATSSGSGEYRVTQLPPGRYTISVAAPNFAKSKLTVDVNPGAVLTANVTLTVGQATTTVEVSATAVPLLHTDDADLSTTISQEQILNLPNPGGDLTFIAQTAAGTVMNTQSGYGNFSSFGLPGTANTFTVNGGYYNDPFLNVNNSGATNLTLGNNDIASVTITSNAYNAGFGGLGGAQVSQTSRSGSNQFHGNAAYWWNGRAMNANDFFNKQYGDPRAFDNVNQGAAAFGGPIKRNKSFFFVNYEMIRVVLPSRSIIYAPDASYQNQVLANLTANGLSSEIPIYQNIFNLYNNAPGRQNATVSTPDTETNPYGTVKFNGTAGNFTHEYLFNGRIDQNIGDQDHIFGHATIDKGVQATYTSLLNPQFDALSPQPSYDGQLGEQHTFSPNVSNQFLFSMVYYRAVFTNTNEAASEKIVPFSLIFADGDLTGNGTGAFPGGLNMIWPQGRNVTGYQFQDDVSWTRRKHTFSFGWTMRRDDITDFSPGEYTTSPEAYTTNGSFQQGYTDIWFQQFPTRSTQPVALYTQGWYGQDVWKPLPNLTLTYGLRMEHNSNPICRTNCFARLSDEFAKVSASTATPYNKLISSGLFQAMNSLQTIGYEPRIGFVYLPFGPGSRTTLRGGFGMFADAFPGQIADFFLNNAPSNVGFTIYGPAFGGGSNALVPVAPGSAASVAAASNGAFSSGFATGANLDTLSELNGFSAPNIATASQHIKYATYDEWSLALEQQVGRADSFSVMYVGNRSYHEPVLNPGVNAFNAGGATGFPELSTTSAPNPNFSSVMNISSESSGNFNGLVASLQHRSRNLTLTLNYQYSHALDEISNGGFDGFSANSVYPDDPSDLKRSYGNADYDTRQYVSGSYVFVIPHYAGPSVLVDNWEFSGTVFHSTGLPFSVVDSGTAAMLSNYGWNGTSAPLYARQIAPFHGTHCGGKSAALGSACSFAAAFAPFIPAVSATATTPAVPAVQSATDFGQSGRNQLFGPNYTDTDLSVTKGFIMPHTESAKLRVGAQFFNLFNHYNFAQPGNNVASGSLGLLQGGVNTPTSILGSFLGGDATPRLIQLTAKFDF